MQNFYRILFLGVWASSRGCGLVAGGELVAEGVAEMEPGQDF